MQNRKGFRAEKKDVKVRLEAETRERLPTEWLYAQKTGRKCAFTRKCGESVSMFGWHRCDFYQ